MIMKRQCLHQLGKMAPDQTVSWGCRHLHVLSTSPFLPFPPFPFFSSLETACILLFTERSSAWIIWLRRYWCIKPRVWFLSRPCHQSQFARALAECNISLIRSTRKLLRWTVLIREEIIKLGAPEIISPSEHYCKPHKKTNPPPPSFRGWDKEETRSVDGRMRFHLYSLCFPSSLSAGSSHPIIPYNIINCIQDGRRQSLINQSCATEGQWGQRLYCRASSHLRWFTAEILSM